MSKKLKIKSLIIVSVALILGTIIFLQISLYSILQKENQRTISSIFDSIAQDSAQQISSLNNEIAELSMMLSVNKIVQENLYEYTPSEIIQNFVSIDNLLIDYMNNNKNIAFLGIIKNGRLFRSYEKVPLYNNVREIAEQVQYDKKIQSIFLSSFIYDEQTYFSCVTPIFPVETKYFSKENNKNFVICIYEIGSISYLTSSFIDNERIQLVITDSNNKILLSDNVLQHNQEFILDKHANELMAKTVSLEEPAWNVNVYMPSSTRNIFSNMTVLFTFFMIIYTLAMLILLLKLLDNVIIKRIRLLDEQVNQIPEHAVDYRVEYSYVDELSNVVTTINQVLGRLQDFNEDRLTALNNLYHAQLMQKETRIFYLYNQVSPHFLYNSLTHIQGLAIEANAPEILTMISSLSTVFRYLSNNQIHSNIKQDIDCAIEYFNIINTQRVNKITLINDVNPELYSVKCLKMVYQPILENTLKHAFSIDNSGTVTISSVPHETKAIIEISDNGRGIPDEKLEMIQNQLIYEDGLDNVQNGEHIGLLNVHLRLKLYYNESCGITVTSKENIGTTIRIIFEKEIPDSKQV